MANRNDRARPPHATEPPTPSHARLWFSVAAAVYVVWVAFLVAMVVTTANPVVVSRLYAGRCPTVVRLRLLAYAPDLPEGQPARRCRVLAVYKGKVVGPLITVAPIPADQREPGRSAVALLRRVRGGLYELLPIANGGYDPDKQQYVPGPPTLLPDTPGVRRQLRAMFGEPSPPAAASQPTVPATSPDRPPQAEPTD